MAGPQRLKGVSQMQSRVNAIARRHPDRVAAALYRQGEFIMTRSKDEFVPVDLGTLRGTGHVVPPERDGRLVRVILAYGGPAAPYALAIHEHLSSHSPPSWRHGTVHFSPSGTGPKYLERPLMEWLATGAEALAKDIGLEGA